MRVSEIMHTDLRTIGVDATVADAVEVFARTSLVGVISQTDIVAAVAAARV